MVMNASGMVRADGEQAVVSQDHGDVAAEVGHQALLLVEVAGRYGQLSQFFRLTI